MVKTDHQALWNVSHQTSVAKDVGFFITADSFSISFLFPKNLGAAADFPDLESSNEAIVQDFLDHKDQEIEKVVKGFSYLNPFI